MGDLHIRELDTGLLVAVIDDYEALDTTRDLQEPGDFKLVINRYRTSAEHLAEGRVLLPDPDAGEAYLIEQIEEETDDRGGGTEMLAVSGRALGCVLEERLCLPPAGSDTDKQVSARAEVAMKQLVRRNGGGATVNAKRKLPNFSVPADRNVGATISYSARYQPVSDALTEIARNDGGGWEVRKKDNANSWEFDYIAGRDLRDSVVFDVTIDSAKRIHHVQTTVGRKDYAIVGGPDAGGKNRTFVNVWSKTIGAAPGQVAADEPSGWARRELYVEGSDVDPARDGNLTTLLVNKGKAALRSSGEPSMLEADVTELGPYRYRRDFDLGDIVAVRNPRWGLSEVQRIVRIRQTRDTSQAEPQTTIELGKPMPTPKGLLRAIGKQASAAGGVAAIGAVDPYPPILSGWFANYDTISSEGGEAVLDSAGILTLGEGNDIVALDAVDATWRVAVGHASYASAPFRVNKAGALFATGATISGTVTATAGSIGGWTITSTEIRDATSNVKLRGAGNIALGTTPPTAANSGTGIFIDGTGIYGLNSNTQEAYLRSSDGKIVAGAGNVILSSSGIAASQGTIGAWTLSATDLRNSGNTVVLRGAGNIAVGSTPPPSAVSGTGVFIDSTGIVGIKNDQANWKLDATTGAMIIATRTTQDQAIALGALGSPPTAANAGTGLWMDPTGLYGLNANTQEFYLRASDGKAVFGGGVAVLDSSGIALSGQLEITGTSIGLGMAVVNSGTGAGKSSSVVLQAHASGDDALTVYRIGPLPTPTQSWGVGIDNSDSDAFVIWEDELTPTNRVHIAVGGAVTLAKTLTANLGLTNGSVALDTPSAAPGIVLRADSATKQRADIVRTTTGLLIRVRDSNNAATTPAITIADGSGDVAGNTTIHGTLTNTKTRSFFVPMSAFASKVGAPSLAFVTPSGGAAIQGAHAWAFDSTNQEAISAGYLTMPVDWDGGNVTPYLYWTKAAVGTGNVVWEVIYASISSGDAIDENATNNNAGATGYAVPGTAGNLAITQVGSAFDPGAANDGITLSIRRSPAAANDTYTGGDVWLVGVRLDYTAVM